MTIYLLLTLYNMNFLRVFTNSRTLYRNLKDGKTINRPFCDMATQNSDLGGKQTCGNKKGIVVGVYEDGKEFVLTPAAEEIDQSSGGKICKHLNELKCHLRLGKASILTDVSDSTVALTSLGPKDATFNQLEQLDEDRENVRVGIGEGVRRLMKEGCGAIQVDPTAAPYAAAEAALLASWRFEEFKSERSGPVGVSPLGAPSPEWEEGIVMGEGQNWARYLADMPANRMAPVDLAQAALDTLCPLGVQVEARDLDWIKAQNMQAFLAVARGSCEPPVFLECTYTGGEGAPVLIAAKGVTFDSGGLCLKPARTMTENRGSMSGAAATLAALRTIALLKVPINVSCVIPLCENMISGQCMKVGDVVPALNGLSIQIEDTDMEGRLMLADALVYGQHKHKPKLVIDVATLTRGVLLAMGGGAFGCFCNSAPAWERMQRAGALTGDRPWRFPLWEHYARYITDEPAVDLRNKGSKSAATCIGAAFLQKFICGPWLHLDVSGVGLLAAGRAPTYLSARRMTGRPTRTLAHFLALTATPH